MVPCLGCGRSFCRICDAPRGAGQYCPACYREQVEKLAGKTENAESVEPVPVAAESGQKGLRKRLGRNKAEAKAREPRQKSSAGGFKEKALAPFRWIDRQVVAAGREIKAAALVVGRMPIRAALFIAWCARWLWREAKDRWPLSLAPRELLEGNPPLKESWPKLLGFVLGGVALWTLLVAFTGIRNPGYSIGVAIIVAGGVVWAMGSRYGPTTGIISAGLVLVCIVMSEFLVQVLFRAGVIKKLDLQMTGLISLQRPSMYYSTFLYRLIAYRLLPSAIIAFMIGWWPLKRRIAWFGFEGRGLEPLAPRVKTPKKPARVKTPKEPREKKKKKPEPEESPRAKEPSKRLRVKPKPSGALSKEDLEAAKEKHATATADTGAPDPEP